MKTLIKGEEFAQFALSIIIFSQLSFPWWVFPALILVPDFSMVGYLINTQAGAFLYNLAHHKAVGIGLGLAGYFLGIPALLLAGVILFGHSSMDRMFGYGLKYPDSFKHTHLGSIGQ